MEVKGFSTTVGAVGFTMSCVGNVGSACNNSTVIDVIKSIWSSNSTEMVDLAWDLVENESNKSFVDSIVRRLSIDSEGYVWCTNDGVTVKSNVRVSFSPYWRFLRIIANHTSDNFYIKYSDEPIREVSAKKKYPVLYELCVDWREGELGKLGKEKSDELRRTWDDSLFTESAAQFIISHVLVSLAVVEPANRVAVNASVSDL